MTAFETEEEIDILSYVIESLNTNISYLETISLKNGKYNLYIAQLIETCINLESEKDDLMQDLDNFSIEDLKDASIERLKKNNEY